MRYLRTALLALATLVASGAASAYELIDLPLEEKVAEADLVAYVRALDPICCTFRDAALDVEEMFAAKVLHTLKGKAEDDIVLVDYGSNFFAEGQFDCCIIGARYLVFLERRKDGSYMPVQNRHGVLLLESP